MKVIIDWYKRYFTDPQAIFLAIFLIICFTVVLTMGDMLAPVLASIVIAYLLEGVVRNLERWWLARFWRVLCVFFAFVAFILFVFLAVTPLMWSQSVELIRELPTYLAQGQEKMQSLPEHYPFISEAQVTEAIQLIRQEIGEMGQHILSISITSIPNIITVLIYLILVPLLVFFFLKDKETILRWFTGLLPTDRRLATGIWSDVDQQLGNYIRGKFWEILIVGVVSYITFAVMGLKYAILLGVLVGFSVLVPYIGAAVVTVPVAIVAYFQWGLTMDFVWLMTAYAIIQALDGNVLVPLIFSEVVNLHPVAIIVAILVFGGLWGFWGIFFAIPLATLVNAILLAWPRPGSTSPDP